MALSKSTTAAQASASNSAGGTTTGSWIDVTGAYSVSVEAKITNGGTGPTLAASVAIDLSPDNGTTVYAAAGGKKVAGTTNSATYTFLFSLPPDTMYLRAVFTDNTGQAVTVQADVTKITAI